MPGRTEEGGLGTSFFCLSSVSCKFLLAKGFSLSENGCNISGEHGDFSLKAEFDELGRLTKLSADKV